MEAVYFLCQCPHPTAMNCSACCDAVKAILIRCGWWFPARFLTARWRSAEEIRERCTKVELFRLWVYQHHSAVVRWPLQARPSAESDAKVQRSASSSQKMGFNHCRRFRRLTEQHCNYCRNLFDFIPFLLLEKIWQEWAGHLFPTPLPLFIRLDFRMDFSFLCAAGYLSGEGILSIQFSLVVFHQKAMITTILLAASSVVSFATPRASFKKIAKFAWIGIEICQDFF